MTEEEKNLTRLQHILFAVNKIQKSLNGLDYQSFITNEDKKDALVTNLTLIGEAVHRLTGDLRQKNLDCPWRTLIQLRNLLVHEYFRIKYIRLWNIAQNDLPHFKNRIMEILNEELTSLLNKGVIDSDCINKAFSHLQEDTGENIDEEFPRRRMKM